MQSIQFVLQCENFFKQNVLQKLNARVIYKYLISSKVFTAQMSLCHFEVY